MDDYFSWMLFKFAHQNALFRIAAVKKCVQKLILEVGFVTLTAEKVEQKLLTICWHIISIISHCIPPPLDTVLKDHVLFHVFLCKNKTKKRLNVSFSFKCKIKQI